MKRKSRAINSFQNAKIALIFYILNLCLQFVFRKVFITKIGVDLLGLNTTATNLLQFLNIAELGVGAAVSYALYKPINENNKLSINEIISVQSFFYKNISVLLLFLGIVLSIFFPLIFKNASVSIGYAYLTFFVLLFNSLLGFFFNYDQILLISDQKEYKLNYVVQGIKIAKIIFQIIVIYYFENAYLLWLLLELLAGIFVTIGLKFIVRKEYPWLEESFNKGKANLTKYSEIIKKTKQLFSHKISAFALNQSGALIIFAFSSLSFVAVYGNYLLIISGVTSLLGALFNSANAGIGNMVAEGNKKKNIAVFDELFTIRFFFGVFVVILLYILAPGFIVLWVGKNFLLHDSTFMLMLLAMFISLTRVSVDSFISAYGLFEDTFAPVIETILNIGLSILLGKLYSINGVLCGSLISLFIIVLGWKPFFLFKKGFNINYKHYLLLYTKNIVISVAAYIIFIISLKAIPLTPDNASAIDYILYCLLCSALFGSILLGAYLVFLKEMRYFVFRLSNLFSKI